MTEICFPQKKYLRGEPPFDLWLEGDPFYNGKTMRLIAWMISTGVKVPYILKDWRKGHSMFELGSDFKGEWVPRIEFLVGEASHGDIARRYGTQPLNSYLRGHFALKAPEWFHHAGKYVLIQQYLKAGCWGMDPPGMPWAGTPTVKEQLAQNNVAIPILFELGFLKPDIDVYFADQSKTYEGLPVSEYFKLFKGRDCHEEYIRWLPTYFRRCRSEDFNVLIDEVISWIPK